MTDATRTKTTDISVKYYTSGKISIFYDILPRLSMLSDVNYTKINKYHFTMTIVLFLTESFIGTKKKSFCIKEKFQLMCFGKPVPFIA